MLDSDMIRILEAYSNVHQKVLVESVDTKLKKYGIKDPFLTNFVYRYESQIQWGSIKEESNLNEFIRQKMIPVLLIRADKTKMYELKNTLYCTKINWNRQVETLESAANAGNGEARMSLSMYKSDPDSYKKQLTARVNDSKENRFKEWINYVTKENDIYLNTPAFQYLILSSILLSTDNKTTTEISPLDVAVVGDIYNTISQNPKNQFNILNYYRKKVIDKASDKMEVVKSGEGEWIHIPSKKNDPENYDTNLKTLMSISAGTPWCIAGYGMANSYLSRGDFYIYFLKNESGGKTGVAAIRMDGDNIAEIKGTMNEMQDMDPTYIPNTLDLVKAKKLKGGEEYVKGLEKKLQEEKIKQDFNNRLANNKELTEDDRKILNDIKETIISSRGGETDYLKNYVIIKLFNKWLPSNKPLPDPVNDIVRENLFNWALENKKRHLHSLEGYISLYKSINYVYSQEDFKNIFNILIQHPNYTAFDILKNINNSNLTENFTNHIKNDFIKQISSSEDSGELNDILFNIYESLSLTEEEYGRNLFKNYFVDLLPIVKKIIEKFLKDTDSNFVIRTLLIYFIMLDIFSDNVTKKELLNLLYRRVEKNAAEVNGDYYGFIIKYDPDNLNLFIEKTLNLQLSQEYIEDASFLFYVLKYNPNLVDTKHIDKFFDIISKTRDVHDVLPKVMGYMISLEYISLNPKTRYIVYTLLKLIEKENSGYLNNNTSDYDAVGSNRYSSDIFINALFSFLNSFKYLCSVNDDYGCNTIPSFIKEFLVNHNIASIDMFDNKNRFIIGLNSYQDKPHYIDRLWTCIKRRYAEYGEQSYYPESIMEEHFRRKGFLNYLEYINDKIEYHYGYNSNDVRNIKERNLNETQQKYLANTIVYNYLENVSNYDDHTPDYDFLKIIYDKVNDNFKRDMIKHIKKFKKISSEFFRITGIVDADSIDNIEINESVIFNLMKSFLLKS